MWYELFWGLSTTIFIPNAAEMYANYSISINIKGNIFETCTIQVFVTDFDLKWAFLFLTDCNGLNDGSKVVWKGIIVNVAAVCMTAWMQL